jgi:thiosulfate dehydrogenase
MACSSAPESAIERGRALFESKDLSPSRLNLFSCASCHDLTPSADPNGVVKTGAPIAGATLRPTYWGGQENDLLRSINACRNSFMIANVPMTADEADAEALYAYLVSLEPGDATPVPFTVISIIDELPNGDAEAGAAVYDRTCAACHGKAHTGEGRLATRVPILPQETLKAHESYSPRSQRLIFIEKVRHGGFYGYSGDMPPYSHERLSDTDLSDLLESIGVLGR